MAPSQNTKKVADLWHEAHKKVRASSSEAKLLEKLDGRLLEQRVVLRRKVHTLESDEGRAALADFIANRSKGNKTHNGQLLVLGDKAKDLISAGASASPPATIAVAGLFLVWDLYRTYTQEDEKMLQCRERIPEVLIELLPRVNEINPSPTDNGHEVTDLRDLLSRRYIAVFQKVLTMTAKLVIALSGTRFSKVVKILAGVHTWGDDLDALNDAARDCHRNLDILFQIRLTPVPIKMANEGRNELHEAAATGTLQRSEMSMLLKTCPIDAKTRAHQWSALMLACERGHEAAVDILLLYAADVNVVNDAGRTALHIAAHEGHLNIVKALLKSRARANLGIRDPKQQRTALMAASARGHADVVAALLKSSKAQLDSRDAKGRTALHIAADAGHTEVVHKLLAGGADVGIADKNGRAAVLDAAQNGHLDVLRRLDDSGVDLDTTSRSGWTALHLAAEYDLLDVVEWLVGKGARADLKTTAGTRVGCRARDVAKGRSRDLLQKLDERAKAGT